MPAATEEEMPETESSKASALSAGMSVFSRATLYGAGSGLTASTSSASTTTSKRSRSFRAGRIASTFSSGALVTRAIHIPRFLPRSTKSTSPGRGSSSAAHLRKLASFASLIALPCSSVRSGSSSRTISAVLRPLLLSRYNSSSTSTPYGWRASTHVGRCSESVSAIVPSRSKSRARYKLLTGVEDHVESAGHDEQRADVQEDKEVAAFSALAQGAGLVLGHPEENTDGTEPPHPVEREVAREVARVRVERSRREG